MPVVSTVVAPVLASAMQDRPSDTSWPPALVYFAIFLLLGALGAGFTIFRRARVTTRRRR
jgi:hypothetical protein